MNRKALDSLVVSGLSAVTLLFTLILYRGATQRFAPWATDAFFLAFGVLGLVITPAVNAISSTLVPTLATCAARRPADVPFLLGTTLWWTAVGSTAATLLIALLAASGLGLFGPVLPQSAAHLVGSDVLTLGPMILFQTMGAVLAAASQASGRYWVPGAAAMCQQAVASLFVCVPLMSGERGLPIAFTLGAVAYLSVLLLTWPWRRSPIRMRLSMPRELGDTARLAVPLIAGTAALQVGLMVLRLLAAQLPPGSITALDLAYRVASALVEVSASGILAVVLTEWSVAVASGQAETLLTRLRGTLALVLFLVLPIPIALHALREPLLRMWLSSSSTEPLIRAATSAALAFFLIGVPLDICGRLYVRVLIARQRTVPLGWLSLQRMLVTIAIAWLLVRFLGVRALALADTLAIALTLLGLHATATGSWRWMDELRWRTRLRIGLAGLLAWLSGSLVVATTHLQPPLIQCALGGAASVTTYLVAAWAFKSPELPAVLTLIKGMSDRQRREGVVSKNVRAEP